MDNRKKKICFIASSGGHLQQLLMLKPLVDKYPSFLLTEKNEFSLGQSNYQKVEIPQINRKERFFLLKFMKLCFLSVRIYLKEKPNYVISTGALCSIPMSIIVKIAGGKIIFIESFAKVSTPTITGKIIYKIADEFIVQWPELLKVYPKAKYGGGIY
ncbi:PssD/Cps14F family polysaccharide biosynthesis glycosyltransferase [Exiguobacterium sp. s36]|uniref:PssD/Cps14F family polysaccharide biosynthesis glycosyltransferase n=1 Tax=Exiguobacterium sp. s36 TaxID=2751227 RepID=UPI00333DD9EC